MSDTVHYVQSLRVMTNTDRNHALLAIGLDSSFDRLRQVLVFSNDLPLRLYSIGPIVNLFPGDFNEYRSATMESCNSP